MNIPNLILWYFQQSCHCWLNVVTLRWSRDQTTVHTIVSVGFYTIEENQDIKVSWKVRGHGLLGLGRYLDDLSLEGSNKYQHSNLLCQVRAWRKYQRKLWEVLHYLNIWDEVLLLFILFTLGLLIITTKMRTIV